MWKNSVHTYGGYHGIEYIKSCRRISISLDFFFLSFGIHLALMGGVTVFIVCFINNRFYFPLFFVLTFHCVVYDDKSNPINVFAISTARKMWNVWMHECPSGHLCHGILNIVMLRTFMISSMQSRSIHSWSLPLLSIGWILCYFMERNWKLLKPIIIDSVPLMGHSLATIFS